MKRLPSAVIALVFLTMFWPADRSSGFEPGESIVVAQSDGGLTSRPPGKVFEDRRDELRGGTRAKLLGLRPRPQVEPRSRVRLEPQKRARPEIDPRVEPLVPRLSRLPVARQTTLANLLAACRARYRSFDAASGTYRTYAGAIRRCPYLP